MVFRESIGHNCQRIKTKKNFFHSRSKEQDLKTECQRNLTKSKPCLSNVCTSLPKLYPLFSCFDSLVFCKFVLRVMFCLVTLNKTWRKGHVLSERTTAFRNSTSLVRGGFSFPPITRRSMFREKQFDLSYESHRNFVPSSYGVSMEKRHPVASITDSVACKQKRDKSSISHLILSSSMPLLFSFSSWKHSWKLMTSMQNISQIATESFSDKSDPLQWIDSVDFYTHFLSFLFSSNLTKIP
jgi:hypothetical protein